MTFEHTLEILENVVRLATRKEPRTETTNEPNPMGPKREVRSLGSLASLDPQVYDQAFENRHTRTNTYGLGQSGISAGLNFQLE